MKQIDLIDYQERQDTRFRGEGSRPYVSVDQVAGMTSIIPRHREINDVLSQKICKDLEVPKR